MTLASWTTTVLDLLLPGAGQVARGRTRSGWNTLAAFLGVGSLLAFSVAWMGLDPRRALVTLVIAWGTFEGLLVLEESPPAAAPPSLRRGLAAWVIGILVWVAVGAVISLRVGLAPIRDHGLWPAFLPGEWVLVDRVDPEHAPDLQGRLVVARTASDLTVGRMVAVGPARVQWSGPEIVVDGKVLPLVDLGDVAIDAPFQVPEEERGLRAWMESVGDRNHPVFFSRLVTTSSREFVLPEGTVLLLADNRSTLDARDGRTLGPLSLRDIVGTVGPVIWSPGPWGLPRWQRIGMQWP
ncbi:MAG TPA: S26 family signal peptidase [Myxococcota bacterium]|nr:S26 family signal peptidase [Myxococcota bacterium]HQK50017.1 S26 family signal peptidase [Myxococcota bacterium]